MVKEWIPWAVRLANQKTECEKCGGKSRLGLHHKDRDRTNNSPENLQTLCPRCHTSTHWSEDKKAWRRHPALCSVCGKPSKRLGLCETHRSRFLRHGSPFLRKIKIGAFWRLTDERTGVESGPVSHGLPSGVPDRVDRLRGLGNAIVPQIAEIIFRGLDMPNRT